MRSRKINCALLGLIFALGVAQPSLSHALSFTLSNEFSGTNAPITGAPVVTMTGTGTVTLTVQSNFTSGSGEFIRGIYLNLNPTYSPTNLSFSFISGQAATDGIFTGTNAFKADGAGFLDVLLSYSTSGPNRFTGLEQSVYQITCAICGAGFGSESFNFLSTPSDKGEFGAVARLQGLGANNEDSGWYGPGNGNRVSEPSGLSLLASSLILLLLIGRRFKVGSLGLGN